MSHSPTKKRSSSKHHSRDDDEAHVKTLAELGDLSRSTKVFQATCATNRLELERPWYSFGCVLCIAANPMPAAKDWQKAYDQIPLQSVDQKEVFKTRLRMIDMMATDATGKSLLWQACFWNDHHAVDAILALGFVQAATLLESQDREYFLSPMDLATMQEDGQLYDMLKNKSAAAAPNPYYGTA